ncbi:MAG: hypothetical protein M1835_008188 [Candelina submexicana]|nr:MAG: hypothetical protein M1835_008188 [Candelina submexicana]
MALEHEFDTAMMRLAISQAEKSPPKPTNFRVGAVLADRLNRIVLATGYTLQLPGNTHAEECCLQTFLEVESRILLKSSVLYTTMEPCQKRLSGKTSCAERIARTWDDGKQGIEMVFYGLGEPDTFVSKEERDKLAEKQGLKAIEYIHLPGFEEEISRIATAGHERPTKEEQSQQRGAQYANEDDRK